MKIAAFIIGIILCIVMGLHTCAAIGLGGFGVALSESLAETEAETAALSSTVSTGLIVGFAVPLVFAILAMAFVLSKPRFAAVAYSLGGIYTGLVVGLGSGFIIMTVYGLVMLILAGLSYAGYREGRGKLKNVSEVQ